jgi:tetratricopeptide repeat protein
LSTARVRFLYLGYDDRNIALVALARALWRAGAPDRAVEAARLTISEAERLDQPVTLGIVLVWMTYVFLWCGDWAGAGQLIERLIGHAAKHSLGPYNAVGLGLKGDLLVRRGEPSECVELLRRGLATLHATQHKILIGALSIALAEGLAQTGQTDEALTVLDAAIRQVIYENETFDMPELLRLKGALLSVPPHADLAGSDVCFCQSLDLARRQSALSWELRTAMTVARILADSGRAIEAHALLEPIYRASRRVMQRPMSAMPDLSSNRFASRERASPLFRAKETHADLNVCHVGGAVEFGRLRYAGLARLADGTEPVLEASRGDHPEHAHLARPGVLDFVLKRASDQDRGFRSDGIALLADFGPALALVAEQHFVLAFVSVATDMGARFQHLDAHREAVVGRVVRSQLVDDVAA